MFRYKDKYWKEDCCASFENQHSIFFVVLLLLPFKIAYMDNNYTLTITVWKREQGKMDLCFSRDIHLGQNYIFCLLISFIVVLTITPPLR